MKTKIIALLSVVLLSATAFGQLNGSGKIVSKDYDYKNFDKINFQDLDGKIDVKIGKTWSIHIDIDDNLAELLQLRNDEKEHELKISLAKNRNNRLYVENTNITITITMPEASVIRHDGNSDLTITNIKGRYFRIEGVSNGNVKISGQTDFLDVMHTGNGNIDAGSLKAKKTTVSSTGNGDVLVCSSDEIAASGSGNGDIINTGSAIFPKDASHSGNGKCIQRKSTN